MIEREVFIREMKKEEIEQCAGIIRRGFGTVAEMFGLTQDNCPTNGAFMKTEKLRADLEKGNHMYVLCQEDEIVGFMQLVHKDSDRMELEKLTVLHKYRHYGYGTRLLEFAVKRAKELDVKMITIGIIEENTVLKNWYLKNGFRHNGTHQFDHLPFTVGFMSLEVLDIDMRKSSILSNII